MDLVSPEMLHPPSLCMSSAWPVRAPASPTGWSPAGWGRASAHPPTQPPPSRLRAHNKITNNTSNGSAERGGYFASTSCIPEHTLQQTMLPLTDPAHMRQVRAGAKAPLGKSIPDRACMVHPSNRASRVCDTSQGLHHLLHACARAENTKNTKNTSNGSE